MEEAGWRGATREHPVPQREPMAGATKPDRLLRENPPGGESFVCGPGVGSFRTPAAGMLERRLGHRQNLSPQATLPISKQALRQHRRAGGQNCATSGFPSPPRDGLPTRDDRFANRGPQPPPPQAAEGERIFERFYPGWRRGDPPSRGTLWRTGLLTRGQYPRPPLGSSGCRPAERAGWTTAGRRGSEDRTGRTCQTGQTTGRPQRRMHSAKWGVSHPYRPLRFQLRPGGRLFKRVRIERRARQGQRTVQRFRSLEAIS